MLSGSFQFDAKAASRFLINNFPCVTCICVAYVVLIHLGKSYMAKRQPFDLRQPVLIWSTVLAIFSFVGAFRTVPELVHSLETKGFKYSVCSFSYFEDNKSTGFWVFLFSLSKVVELLDTAFIVLRKKKMILLHWYHHFSVLLYVWYMIVTRLGAGRWFASINFSVHALMYSYYAVSAAQIKVPKLLVVGITCSQILQMIVGLYVSLRITDYWLKGNQCEVNGTQALLSLVLYGSYLILFSNFFVQTYLKPSGRVSMLKEK